MRPDSGPSLRRIRICWGQPRPHMGPNWNAQKLDPQGVLFCVVQFCCRCESPAVEHGARMCATDGSDILVAGGGGVRMGSPGGVRGHLQSGCFFMFSRASTSHVATVATIASWARQMSRSKVSPTSPFLDEKGGRVANAALWLLSAVGTEITVRLTSP